jgi:hypothetical protein
MNHALELLTVRCSDATMLAGRTPEVTTKRYRQGEAAAYNDAFKTMKAELERLRNLWQNGSITYSDFTGV